MMQALVDGPLGALLPTRLRFMLDRSLDVSDIIDKAAAWRPDAVVFRLDERLDRYGVHGDAISATALRGLLNRLSNLMAAHGVRRFDRVAVWKRNSLDYFLLSYAAMRLGGVAVPINGGMELNGLRRFLELTGARLLCTDEAGLAALRRVPDALPASVRGVLVTDADADPAGGAGIGAGVGTIPCWSLAGLAAQPDAFAPPPIAPDGDVLICHTSGTTGFPKGVLHASRSLALAARGQIKVQPVTRRNLALSAGWMNHHIMITGCLAAIVAGLPLIPAVNLDPDALLDRIERDRVNLFFAFPDVYQRMLRAGLERRDMSSIRLWMSGGDAMHEAHIRRLVAHGAFLRVGGRRVMGSMFCELLGTSEVGIVALMKLSHAGTRRYGRCVGRRTPVSPDVKVADAEGRRLPPGAVGRLMVKGPTVFKGYWNDHARSHGEVVDGWWWTGDLAFRDRRGRFYQLDREVDSVRTHAGVVHGLLVEEEALKHPDLLEAALFAAPGPDGDVPMLLAQAAPGRWPDPAEIKAFVEARVALPTPLARVVVVTDDADVPRGLTGKVLKRVLRDRHGGQAPPVARVAA